MALEVFEEQTEYLRVRVDGIEGFVHREFIRIGDRAIPAGFLRARPDLVAVPLEVPLPQQIDRNAAASNAERLAADTWNRYGNLLTVLSGELGIDPAAAVAVLGVEAGGQAFGPSGRMIIRFENHIFYDQWGQFHPDTFFQHFAFSPNQSWQGHGWRPSPARDWQEFHGDQAAEWRVFEFACGLDDTAAKRSISMGAPQIMGFNSTAVGCETVQEMFDCFAGSERDQIIGFFDFVAGGTTDSARVLALQQQDFFTFAALYNGSGQASTYAGLIRDMVDAFHRVRR
jgi:hypothetical protein